MGGFDSGKVSVLDRTEEAGMGAAVHDSQDVHGSTRYV